VETVSSSVEDIEWIVVEDSSAPGRVRRSSIALARRLGFSEHRTGEVAIAATELGTNLQRHAVAGAVSLRIRREGQAAAVELLLVDSGPGFADLAVLASDGHSSRGTLGIGLGAVMRLATWFDSHSVPARGTAMIATFWSVEAPVKRSGVGALTRPIDSEEVCGDAWAQRFDGQATTILLADGLGHGELAAIASRDAVRAFHAEDPSEAPARVIERLNGLLRSTRGAAIAVIRLDPENLTLTFAGVGNIAVWADDGEKRRGLLSAPGIVGHNARKFREIEMPVSAETTIVMHSDGLTTKWDLNRYPGLRVRDPNLIAAILMRDAGLRHDDASVVVAKAS
jgi:anti-sigma regulatory factor (Ser/Thr protein kinase)